MAKPLHQRPVVSSVLDRLLDDNPGARQDPPTTQAESLRKLKADVRRDLENLFNTRLRYLRQEPILPELNRSLINYGLPDFAAMALRSDDDRARFCRRLEEVVRQFEPRLLDVRVHPVSESDPIDRTFRFRIDARLRVEPAPEPVVFDSQVRPATGTFEVQGASG